MAVAQSVSIEVQQLIARVSNRIMQTDELVAMSRALARETRHIIRACNSTSETSDSLSYENDWDVPLITADPEAVQS